jgi:Protein kinase domain
MARCARCSAENPDSTRFCGHCGARLDAQSPASLIATEASNTSRTATAARLSRPPSSSDTSEDGRFVPGTLLGDRYRIVSRLGAGGMGEVYRATDLRLGQAVALKFLPEEMVHDPKALARFHNEIRIARQVAHPNVCRVYDLGEVEGFPYLSMEYVDGEDLHSLLRRIGRLPADKAVEIARKLCAGLAAAHDKGVLHRDLKPANIMVDGRGQVLITDFGLAGLAGQIEGLETRNGTPGYMAPEQLTGKEVSVASDVYALGVVLYEMFTGKRPFNASSRAELVEKEEEGLPPAPRTIVKDIDPAVESVILRCLDPNPRKRPPSALAVLGALPGGDPLAAALAAGETPSPEMVAAAGTTAGLKAYRAIAWLAGILFAIAVLAVLDQHCELIAKIPFEHPPEVLAAKAREILGQIGYPERPVSQAYGFDYRLAPLRYLASLPKPIGPRLAKGRPAVMRFWYRTSPAPLAPHEITDVIRVRYADPPNIVPGMVSMQLDPQGRLWYLDAVPPELPASPASLNPPDWGVLFRAAGLDMSRFRPDAPQWTPPVETDARAAWSGSFAEAPEIPLHVEAAAYRGKPVYFFMAGPWSAPATPEQASGDDKPPGEVVYIILQLIVIIGSIPIARYNVKLGRGDTRGAMRLGLFCAAVGIAAWAIGGTHVPSVKEADLFFMAVMRALIGGVSVAVTYISFEPFVRRRWPQTLISWSRLLAGGLRDPLVGRDVLVGTAMGLALALIQALGNQAYRLVLGESVRLGIRQAVLSGGRDLVGETLFQINDSLYKGLGILFLIFVARAVLRSEWIAAGVVTLALAGIVAPSQSSPWIGWPVEILFFALMVMTMMRCGLLSMVIALFVTTFVGFFPLSADLSVWYASEVLFTAGVVVALAVYGFRTALAGQKLFVDA